MASQRSGSFSPASTPIWTTRTKYRNYTNNINSFHHKDGSNDDDPSNNYPFSLASTPNNASIQTGSTMKLIPTKTNSSDFDEKNKQSKSSIFRSVLLCLCLNLTFANTVRFPRELHQYGTAFLVPYLILYLCIGVPIVLLEVSLGQFLGQGAANIWRSAPFLKGGSILGRFASWLSAIWMSGQAAVALLYIGMLSFKLVPFRECTSTVKIDQTAIHNGYDAIRSSGQECLKMTFLRPVWRNSLYFGLLAITLILLWTIVMVCTHCAKINRRSIYSFGFISLLLLVFATGWEVTKSINDDSLPDFWPFTVSLLKESTIWFSALIQVIYSLNIGIGALPVLTGKYLYKGDAVRTSVVYICFNILITIISLTFYLLQFSNSLTKESEVLFPELLTLTVIMDRAQTHEHDPLLKRLIPGLSYAMILFSILVSIVIFVYTSTRIIRRHPNYTVCLAALVVSIAGLLPPNFLFSRLLDSRIVGTVIICAMIFEIIAVIWVYGSKNLFTDLEFSLGRPVVKVWIVLWAIIPLVLVGFLVWWNLDINENDLLITYIPKWLPIAVCIGLIIILACVEVGKQVDYNLISMIRAATKPSKDWGPADPLVRHAWKQWKSVCEHTGERDFTLRRRGTKDYTNSIKKGQYSHSHANKYGTTNRNIPTSGSNSPNYSASIFGDSAIEEDISVDKYPNYSQRCGYTIEVNDKKLTQSPQTVSTSRKTSMAEQSQIGLIPSSRKTSENSYTSRIEIMPEENHRPTVVRNPMAKYDPNSGFYVNGEHICWRMMASEEFSTEL